MAGDAAVAGARSASFERVADSYDDTRGGTQRGRRLAAGLADLLPAPPAGPLVEVGVGTGVVAVALTTQGWSVAGFDISPGMLARARRRLGPRVALGDAGRLPVRDRAAAAVVAVWVLHVVADPVAALREVARVLRPGAPLLAVSAAQVRTEPSDLDELIDRMWESLRPQGRPDTAERLVASGTAAGLQVAEVRRLSAGRHGLSPAEVARRMRARSYSVLWDVDPPTWESRVRPLIEVVERLPDQDRPRVTPVGYDCVVLTAAVR